MSQRPSFSLDAPLDQSMLCLEASAGTGKTYTIEGLITRLIVEEGIGIHELLVVTFTRAATAEYAHRFEGARNDSIGARIRWGERRTSGYTPCGLCFVQHHSRGGSC